MNFIDHFISVEVIPF